MGIEPMSSIVIGKSSTSLAYFVLQSKCYKISKKHGPCLFEMHLAFPTKRKRKNCIPMMTPASVYWKSTE